MKRFKANVVNIFGILCILIGMSGVLPAVARAFAPPDLTQGDKRDQNHDWLLGPTGARGWIYGSKGQTAEARQILITAVAAGSPADGVLRSGDVILGVDDKPFTFDARKSFGGAITAAEEKTGALRLIRWRDGQAANVELKLAALGKYSDAAPYDCPKSQKIFEQGCRLIAKKGLKEADIPIDLNALALLASGRQEYRPMLADYARKVSASLQPGIWCWYYAYGNLYMAEYVLATGDQSVMPELRRTTMEAVKAQCMNGMWGHCAALADGHSEGYGGMNQIGLPMTIALVLAREAGVHDPVLDRAIERSVRLLRWFVDKGAIPYGDHQPWPGHEDNGKCSAGAVLFDLLGDREAASFYARMSTAGYAERERGHTGNFFNILWALPGVSRCGPLATGAYWKEQSWYYDLARGCDGGFVYQGSPVGEEEHGKYTDWDCTGAYLLAYALPLKSLYITGKKPCFVPPLNRKEANEVIAAGRDFFPVNGKNGYDQRKTEDLLAGLSSWSPSVRLRSAQALGRREGDFAPSLQKLLAASRTQSGDRYGRYGACVAIGYLGSRADAAAPQLRAVLEDQDPWMVSLACNAIAGLGPQARKGSINDLLELAASKNSSDPWGMTNRAVATALFTPYPGSNTPTILNRSLEGVDRRLLYPAMRALLRNDDSVVRDSLAPYLKQLTDRDLAVMLPEVIKAIEQMAPSNEMFADDIRTAGLDLLSRRHIREGMELCVSTIEWRWGNELQPRLDCLKRYGVHAREVLPQLRKKRPEGRDGAMAIDKCIAAIEASKDSPNVVDLKDFIAHASATVGVSNSTNKGTR
jgi:hypothetical protein